MNNAKVVLCSNSPSTDGGIAAWTKHILQYYKLNASENFSLSHFPFERKYFIDPSSTPVSKRIIFGIRDYWGIIFSFRKKIKQEKPNVVHITTSASLGLIRDLIMIFIIKSEKINSIIHFHFGRIPELKEKGNWEWRLLRFAIKKADYAIVIDRQSYTTLVDSGYKNVCFLPNPISPDLLSSIEKFKNIERSKRTILFAGHLLKTKGVFEIVRACIRIPNIKIRMMGKAQSGIPEQLFELAKEKGNADWIEILANQNSEVVVKEMLSATVFVLPSYTEGFPNVILESMVCKCPIVATAVGAIPEMLNCNSNEEAGICVAPKNVGALQKGIEQMLENKIFSQHCVENAHKRVLEKYSITVVCGQLNSIWENVLEIKR